MLLNKFIIKLHYNAYSPGFIIKSFNIYLRINQVANLLPASAYINTLSLVSQECGLIHLGIFICYFVSLSLSQVVMSQAIFFPLGSHYLQGFNLLFVLLS